MVMYDDDADYEDDPYRVRIGCIQDWYDDGDGGDYDDDS